MAGPVEQARCVSLARPAMPASQGRMPCAAIGLGRASRSPLGRRTRVPKDAPCNGATSRLPARWVCGAARGGARPVGMRNIPLRIIAGLRCRDSGRVAMFGMVKIGAAGCGPGSFTRFLTAMVRRPAACSGSAIPVLLSRPLFRAVGAMQRRCRSARVDAFPIAGIALRPGRFPRPERRFAGSLRIRAGRIAAIAASKADLGRPRGRFLARVPATPGAVASRRGAGPRPGKRPRRRGDRRCGCRPVPPDARASSPTCATERCQRPRGCG